MVKKTKKKFKGGVSRNAAKQTKGAQFGHLNLPRGISVFKEEPKSRIDLDILPYEVTADNHPDRDDEYGVAVPGELWYKRPYYLHRGIGVNNDSIVCPTSAGQKCPVCEYRAQLLKDGADYMDEFVKTLKPSMRNLYVVVPKGSKNHPEEPHIWDISQFLFQAKLNEEISEDESFDSFPDLEEGYTLRIRFTEESFGKNKFADTSRIDFVERKKPYDESILETVPSLDEVLEIPAYKTIEAIFFGGLNKEEAEDIDEEDDDGESTDYVIEDEDEEDDEPEEVEDEKPAPAPKRTKPSGTKDNRCPHGHKFGEECEDHDECDDCTEWEACMDASEGLDA